MLILLDFFISTGFIHINKIGFPFFKDNIFKQYNIILLIFTIFLVYYLHYSVIIRFIPQFSILIVIVGHDVNSLLLIFLLTFHHSFVVFLLFQNLCKALLILKYINFNTNHYLFK
jgi:hypothetical protein